MFERDDFTCQYCGQSAPDVVLHVDHKRARANGGSDSIDNLITACSACNIGKRAKPARRRNVGNRSMGAEVLCDT